jgi:hypothetical protein
VNSSQVIESGPAAVAVGAGSITKLASASRTIRRPLPARTLMPSRMFRQQVTGETPNPAASSAQVRDPGAQLSNYGMTCENSG